MTATLTDTEAAFNAMTDAHAYPTIDSDTPRPFQIRITRCANARAGKAFLSLAAWRAFNASIGGITVTGYHLEEAASAYILKSGGLGSLNDAACQYIIEFEQAHAAWMAAGKPDTFIWIT